jgi:two-component system, OmpR family, response regulator
MNPTKTNLIMEETIRILLAEDDSNLSTLLEEYLKLKGYEVNLFNDGEAALKGFKTGEYDICLLDVMMPRMDGFTLAKEIRKSNDEIPIIFLTAKSMKDDKIEGFNLGADDYITKPFSMEELLMRVKAVLRRTHRSNGEPEPTVFEFGRFHFDFDHQLLKIDGETIKLTTKESDLLRMLCKYKNRVLEREEALNKIWGNDSYFTARSMDVFITKLRKYLKADPNVQIINIHGTGYKLTEMREA